MIQYIQVYIRVTAPNPNTASTISPVRLRSNEALAEGVSLGVFLKY